MSPLNCLAEAMLTHRPYHLVVSPGEQVVVACSSEGAVTILSPELRVLGSLELGCKVDGIAVGSHGQYLGFSLPDQTCVMTTRGEVIREVRHDPWPYCAGGGCTFSPDGRFFWAVRPGADERGILVEVTRCDRWQVVAVADFEAEEEGIGTWSPTPRARCWASGSGRARTGSGSTGAGSITTRSTSRRSRLWPGRDRPSSTRPGASSSPTASRTGCSGGTASQTAGRSGSSPRP